MEEASNQRDPPPTEGISEEKQQTITLTPYHHFQALTPIWRLSPRNGGSTLYDSYELRAVTQKLNRAIQGSQASSSPYPSRLKSPFYSYRKCRDRVYKENAKTPKRVTCSRLVNWTPEAKASSCSSRSFVPRVWKKLKQTFLRNKEQSG